MGLWSRLCRVYTEKRNHYELMTNYSEFLGKGIYSELNHSYRKSIIGFPLVKKEKMAAWCRNLLNELCLAEPASIRIIRGGVEQKGYLSL